MQKIILLIFTLIISTVCYAKQPCSNKTSVRNYHFNLNAQSYKFTSYFCDYETESFSEPAILEVHGKNINKSLKNVIGIKGGISVGFSKWNSKPEFYYISTPSDYTEAYMPIIIKDNNLMVDCIYINRQLKNLMQANYSYCGEPQIVADGFDNDQGFEHLFPDFYLNNVYFYIFFEETKKSLSYKEFDVFIGKIDDISFYRRYSSIKNYGLNKYTVIMANQDKEYRFKESQIYQRMASQESAESFIGLDIIDSKGKITFYDKTALAKRLNKSTIKRNIKSYIQQEKIPLYDEPNDSHPTDMYLVRDDYVKILDVIWNKEKLKKSQYPDTWFKVSYKSKEQGEIVKWIEGYVFFNWMK